MAAAQDNRRRKARRRKKLERWFARRLATHVRNIRRFRDVTQGQRYSAVALMREWAAVTNRKLDQLWLEDIAELIVAFRMHMTNLVNHPFPGADEESGSAEQALGPALDEILDEVLKSPWLDKVDRQLLKVRLFQAATGREMAA